MKKIIWRIVLVILVLVVLVVLAGMFFLDPIVKRGVETVGPSITKVPVTVSSVHISLLGASGSVKGLVVGNPEGYKTPNAISIGKAHLGLKLGSLLSDKIVVKSIEIREPEITLEVTLHGSNLKSILDNVEGSDTTTATPAPTPTKTGESKPAKKIQVDDFLITGAKVKVSVQGMAGNSIPVPIPEIHLTDLGTAENGITAGELTKRVLKKLLDEAIKAGADAASKLGKETITKEAGKVVNDAAGKVTEGLGNLLKKK